LIRTRKAGDSFTPIGMKNRKKLKDFFINQKIDKYTRNILPIVVNDDRIVCVGNIRMSDEFKISDKTNKLIKIELKEVDYRG
jgi:tRNA(Ile)-lysidine synthase